MSNIPIKMPLDIVEGSECLENEVPWIVPEAIYKLDDELNDKDTVLEVGSGGSTLFFARRCQVVSTVETSNDWAKKVLEKINRDEDAPYVIYAVLENEQYILKCMRDMKAKETITVFSVDTQGGYNRSKILDAFLEGEISPNLRMIILDNYGHEGLFPDHYNKQNFMGEDWEMFTYNHERWAGNGTRIFIRK